MGSSVVGAASSAGRPFPALRISLVGRYMRRFANGIENSRASFSTTPTFLAPMRSTRAAVLAASA